MTINDYTMLDFVKSLGSAARDGGFVYELTLPHVTKVTVASNQSTSSLWRTRWRWGLQRYFAFRKGMTTSYWRKYHSLQPKFSDSNRYILTSSLLYNDHLGNNSDPNDNRTVSDVTCLLLDSMQTCSWEHFHVAWYHQPLQDHLSMQNQNILYIIDRTCLSNWTKMYSNLRTEPKNFPMQKTFSEFKINPSR